MKHTAVITYHRATCSCGQMQGVWRGENEAIGIFTIRAHAIFEQHRDNAEAPVDLFDYRQHMERPVSAQGGLFAEGS